MERGTADLGFQTRPRRRRCRRISDWGADTLVLALGLDAFVGDPFAGLARHDRRASRRSRRQIAALNLPTLIVQEGGYLCPELGDNLAAVLKAWTLTFHFGPNIPAGGSALPTHEGRDDAAPSP